jgi:hypothetical protein
MDEARGAIRKAMRKDKANGRPVARVPIAPSAASGRSRGAAADEGRRGGTASQSRNRRRN